MLDAADASARTASHPRARLSSSAEVIVDDRDPWYKPDICLPDIPCEGTGFKQDGPQEFWRRVAGSSAQVWAGSALWTGGAATVEDATNWATWAAILAEPGNWEVQAFVAAIDTGRAITRRARYCVATELPRESGLSASPSGTHTRTCEEEFVADQAAAVVGGRGAWVSLGTYEFPEFVGCLNRPCSAYGSVMLADWVAPGDPSFPVSVLFDAVRWIIVPTATATPPPTATGTPTPPAPTQTARPPSPTVTRRAPTAQPTAEATVSGGCGSAGGDPDKDGLCSDWERQGYNGVDLPGLGADPNHQDIFVEMDYIAGFRPKPDFIPLVEQAFAAQDIALHVDLDDRLGSHGRSNAVRGYGPRVTREEFKAIKEANFGRYRRGLFHYALAVGSSSSSALGQDELGYGEHPLGTAASALDGRRGDDFIVAVGAINGRSDVPVITQASIFMHELGHNLGLLHGGPYGGAGNDKAQALLNHKPNQLSVMNYALGFRGLIYQGSPGHLDYARYALPALDEARLDERQGLGADQRIAAYGTVFFCPSDRAWAASGRAIAATGMIDWDCNGHFDDAVRANVNGDRGGLLEGPTISRLDSSPEWDHLVLTGGDIGHPGQAATFSSSTNSLSQAVAVEELREPPLSVLDEQRSSHWVRVLGATRAVGSPGEIDVPFTVVNAGELDDSYSLSAAAAGPGIEIVAAPGTVRLRPGEERGVTVVARLLSLPSGSEDVRLKLSARSGAAPRIADAAYVSISPRSPGLGQIFLPVALRGFLSDHLPPQPATPMPAPTMPPPTLTPPTTFTPVSPTATRPPLSLRGALSALSSECVVHDGRFAFVGSTDRVAVVDVSAPETPEVVTTIPSIGCPLTVADAHLMGASGRAVRVIDVSGLPASFADLGIRHSEGLISVYGLSAIGVSGSKIIASEGRHVIRVFERGDPLLSQPTGHSVPGWVAEALWMRPSGGFVVANMDHGLAFVNASGVVRTQKVPGNPIGLCAEGGFVANAGAPIFVASANFGVLRVAEEVVDKRLDTPGDPRAIECVGDRVYVVDRRSGEPSGVLILDHDLATLASATTDGGARDIAVMNNVVLLADGDDGLKVLTDEQ